MRMHVTMTLDGPAANHFRLVMITYSPTNAFMVWHRPIWLTCVFPFRRSPAGGSCGRQTAGH